MKSKNNVTIVTEARFFMLPNGTVWSYTGYEYNFWKRYLSVFDHVWVMARVKYVDEIQDDSKQVDGENVSFVDIPYFVGHKEFLKNFFRIKRVIAENINPFNTYILRVPGTIGNIVYKQLAKKKLPFGLEIVGDPQEVFSANVVKHSLRILFKWWFTSQLKRQAQNASCVAYVTEATLQQHYPAKESAFTTFYSSIEMKNDDYVQTPRKFTKPLKSAKLVFIGSIEQRYKGLHILIDAVEKCIQELDISLDILGEGRYRSELELQVKKLGLTNKINFIGHISTRQVVIEYLDTADIFVLPSLTEGLPRVVIEAMARALPCISTTVGGIPELLPAEYMVAPNSVDQLAEKIIEVAGSVEQLNCMSERNLHEAKKYSTDKLNSRKYQFYYNLKQIKEVTTILQ